MPQIPGYEERIAPQGFIGTQASPTDFGAQVGAAVQGIGARLGEASEAIQKVEEDQGSLWAYNATSAEHLKLRQQFKERVDTLDPKAQDFMPKVQQLSVDFQKQINDSADTLIGQAPTKAARRFVAAHMAESNKVLMTEAFNTQARINGEYTANQLAQGVDSDGRDLFTSPTPENLQRALTNMRAAADNLKSVDPATKLKIMEGAERNLRKAMAKGAANVNARGVIADAGSSNENLLLNAYESLIQKSNPSGAQVLVSKETMQKAPEIVQAAAGTGLPVQILAAQVDTGAKGEPAEQAQAMSQLLVHYGGDFEKALAAYHSGVEAIDGAIGTLGTSWKSGAPAEALQYMTTVLDKSAHTPPAGPAGPRPVQPLLTEVPATSRTPGKGIFEGLTWEDQVEITHDALQNVRLELEIARSRNELANQMDRKAREESMSKYSQRILMPSKYGGTITWEEIAADKTLGYDERMQLSETMRVRAQRSETEGNPGLYRDLYFRIISKDGDPNKIYSADVIRDAFKRGLSPAQTSSLLNTFHGMKDDTGSTFHRKFADVAKYADSYFRGRPQYLANPDQAKLAFDKWKRDAEDMFEADRAAGKNPADRLDARDPRNYIADKTRLDAVVHTPAEVLELGAHLAGQLDQTDIPKPGEEMAGDNGQIYVFMPDKKASNYKPTYNDGRDPKNWVPKAKAEDMAAGAPKTEEEIRQTAIGSQGLLIGGAISKLISKKKEAE